MLSKNKKGQLSDAMTWIVATLIIIVLLVVFFYASLVMAKWKSIPSEDSIDFEDSGEGVDLIEAKSSFAFEKDKNNELKIRRWLNEE